MFHMTKVYLLLLSFFISLIPYSFFMTLFKNFQYMKHLVYKVAKSGWHVVVSNHRGLGGVSITVRLLSL